MESGEQWMWTKGTCEKLSRVEVKLAASVESLIGMQPGSGPRQRAALMNEAAALLQAIYREMHAQEMHAQEPAAMPRRANLAAQVDKAEVLRLLCGIQVRVGQLEQLNEAALGLCRGWLSVQPPPAIDYTCEGIWAN